MNLLVQTQMQIDSFQETQMCGFVQVYGCTDLQNPTDVQIMGFEKYRLQMQKIKIQIQINKGTEIDRDRDRYRCRARSRHRCRYRQKYSIDTCIWLVLCRFMCLCAFGVLGDVVIYACDFLYSFDFRGCADSSRRRRSWFSFRGKPYIKPKL